VKSSHFGRRWNWKFGFGALILFGLSFETLATTLGDLRPLFAGSIFSLNVATITVD